MTFIELLVVMSVMTVAVTMFVSMVVHTSRQRGINRENAIAANAARTVVELMRNEEFRDIYPLYNEDPDDDPGGAGTAPGHRFEVPGLTPLPGWPDDLVGTVRFPVLVQQKLKVKAAWGDAQDSDVQVIDGALVGGEGFAMGGGPTGGAPQLAGGGGGNAGGGVGGGGGIATNYFLREDFVDTRMGMPRDLNGDSIVDDYDHAEDYTLLPIHVEIEWRGDFGPRRFDLYTQIAQFQQEEE
ncbi:MAG: type II secretion system protein [Planctomycetota bacterium]